MSDNGGNPVPNGSNIDPLKRLSSFKPPRDLTLGASKANKKVFTPNLNVSRNKNKSALPNVTKDKKSNERNKRDKKNDRNANRKGPSVIQSSGVFSEGMGAAERLASRVSYGRDVDVSAATLQKPTIRLNKDIFKVDKKLEEQKVRKILGGDDLSDEELTVHLDKDAPVRLPLGDGGWLHSKPKAVAIKVKQEIKEETDVLPSDVKEPVPDYKKDVDSDTDMVTLLKSDKPTLIMLQVPPVMNKRKMRKPFLKLDSLPARGKMSDDGPPKKSQGNNQQPSTSTEIPKKPVESKCTLSDLEEGRIGKLLIHKSGRIRLQLGDSMFEVSPGTQAAFRQELVSVATDEASRSANIISLGNLPHKLNILPHWESLLADMAL